jgi:acetyl esterase/lipase
MRHMLAAFLLIAGATCALADPAVVTTDIPYGDLDRQKLDLYVPADVASDAPALVFFYGGGWQEGTKKDIRETAMSLAATGMIVAAPDYRLYPQVVFPQFVEDCAAAVARVRMMLGEMGGRHRLFIGGHSAGAFNAAMLAADKHYLSDVGVPADAVAGYVLLSGPYEMGGYIPAPYAPVFPPDTRDRANVTDFIDGKEPPILLMTVETDDVVGPHSADRLASAVMVHGGRSVVATYAGSDHIATFWGLSKPDSAVRKDVAAFMAAVTAQ